jgi:hypothetical protein
VSINIVYSFVFSLFLVTRVNIPCCYFFIPFLYLEQVPMILCLYLYEYFHKWCLYIYCCMFYGFGWY